MSVNLPIDPRTMPDGVILIFHIRYAGLTEDADATRGRTMPKVWTYALMKAGGFWYTTGAGRVPQAAGWGAVEKWLERDGRDLVRVEIVTGQRTIWPPEVGSAMTPIQATVGEPIDDRLGCLEEEPFSPGA